MKNNKIILFSFGILCVLLAIVYFKNEPKFIDKALYQSLLEQKLSKKPLLMEMKFYSKPQEIIMSS